MSWRTLRVAEADGKGDSLGLALRHIGGGVPDPAAVGADVGRQLHIRDNVVVGADLEGLVTAHDEARALVLLVAEEADIASTALLPFAALGDEAEELGTHLEELLLALLVGDGLDLLGQLDNGLEVDVLALGGLVLQIKC